jgi:hypothetical protein
VITVVIQLEFRHAHTEICTNRATHVINDVLLCILLVSTGHVNRADDVHLIVFKRYVPFVHIYDVICVVYPESETDTNETITIQHNTQMPNCPFKIVLHQKIIYSQHHSKGLWSLISLDLKH